MANARLCIFNRLLNYESSFFPHKQPGPWCNKIRIGHRPLFCNALLSIIEASEDRYPRNDNLRYILWYAWSCSPLELNRYWQQLALNCVYNHAWRYHRTLLLSSHFLYTYEINLGHLVCTSSAYHESYLVCCDYYFVEYSSVWSISNRTYTFLHYCSTCPIVQALKDHTATRYRLLQTVH